MKPAIKAYLKRSFKEFLLSLIFPAIVFFLVKDKTFVYFSIAVNVLGFIPGYYRYQDSLRFNKKLRDRGLTHEDLANIKFVKNWDDIRTRGIIKYSLIDGGIFFGFALCGIFSIIALLTINGIVSYISSDLSNMFNFIGYTYLAGATTGIISYRLMWTRNEQKFIRLTDPLH
jgi:hypothetical protein